MSWGGYIPGSLLRELTEAEQAKLIASVSPEEEREVSG